MPDPSENWPHYSRRQLPSSRYIPGQSERPEEDTSVGNRLIRAHLVPEAWRNNEDYLYGIDCYNFGYWWECHECLEMLWQVVGPKTVQGHFFQGLIQCAAGNLKRLMEIPNTDVKLWKRGLKHLSEVADVYMGCRVRDFERDTRDYWMQNTHQPARLRLGDS